MGKKNSVKAFILTILSVCFCSCHPCLEKIPLKSSGIMAEKKNLFSGEMSFGDNRSESPAREMPRSEKKEGNRFSEDGISGDVDSSFSEGEGFASAEEAFMGDSPRAVEKMPDTSEKGPVSVNLAEKHFYRQYSRRLGIEFDGTENKKLLMAVDEWMGTPYLWGGCSEKGIDCSCLIKNIYKKVYDIDLNRTSMTMCNEDFREVDSENLREGDIICFDMKKKGISHVGLYLKNNQFVHASLSGGVRISSLGRNYFKKRLVMAGRAVSPRQSREVQIARLSIGELLIVSP